MRKRWFPDRRALGASIAMLCCAYLAYPYITLYRLGDAVQRGNVALVMGLVDWNSVRSGIAEDVASAMTGSQQRQATPDELPAFGASFASSVATTAVDQELTPTAFAASFVTSPGERPRPETAHLSSAFFASPTRFLACLRMSDGAKVRLQLDLIGARWMVTRAWLPPAMLTPRRT